jgi:hypothetical protein
MNKIFSVLNVVIFIFVIYLAFVNFLPIVSEKLPDLTKSVLYSEGLCEKDEDCVVFGETGQCNCGCYNKNNFPEEIGEDCFCLAPTSCRCIEGQCKGFYEKVDSFEDCVRAGAPILESYPRQCKINNTTYTEEYCIDEETSKILTLERAREVAQKSECGDRLLGVYSCNKKTGTYWIDLDLKKEGCNPACVVDIKEESASINWRCTGLTN